ncbi:hypothetical protein ROE7235_03693 [Roseibaca ekhonensis]|uniref:Uncharacterized protein n=1 Tax=Roseinatronobacter ekhonensis TaxID=254356 RepID=A0A3B0MDM1_9RHOB|nr:hypothetical protein ROE7235_03693 [Roseibaca ekhonensis]
MFGWQKKEKSAEDRSLPEIEIGSDGRPRPPHFSGLMNDLYATRSQRMAAIEWAIRWRKVEALTPEDLIGDLDQLLSGHALKKKHPHRMTISMAKRALNLSAQRNRMHRSKRALPWAEFRVGPEECSCRVALEKDKLVRAVEQGHEIPLVGCDRMECLCWTRQLTSAQIKRPNQH